MVVAAAPGDVKQGAPAGVTEEEPSASAPATGAPASTAGTPPAVPSTTSAAERTFATEVERIQLQLPKETLAAADLITQVGHTHEQAAKLLDKFAPYLRKQQAMLHAAVDARAWCPKNDASGEPVFDRTQKTVQAISHSVKGAAGMVFAQRLAHVSKTLQDSTRVLAAQTAAAEHELEARAAVEVWSLEANFLLEVLESGDATDVVRSNHHHHRRSPKARAT